MLNYSVISGRIRRLIEEQGMPLREIEKETGINNATLSQWQQGKRKPRLDSVQILAEYFGVSVDWILGLSDTKKIDASVRAASEYTRLSDRAVEVLNKRPQFKPMTPEEAKEAVKSGNLERSPWTDSEMRLLSKMIEDGSLQKIVHNIDQYQIQMKYDKEKRKRFEATGEKEEGVTIGTVIGGREVVVDTVFSEKAEIHRSRAQTAVILYTEKLDNEIQRAGDPDGRAKQEAK